jgi:PiT family inorganic phosphate transporter
MIANGSLGAGADPPFWVIAAAGAAIALGTYSGGWRIMRMSGARIIKMDAAQGFSAQGAGAATILAATFLGFPISSTHAISGGVMGAGAARRVSAVRWGVAGNIVTAWLLTLPASAAIGAAAYGVARAFGTGSLGPVVVMLLALLAIGLAFARRSQRGTPVPAS